MLALAQINDIHDRLGNATTLPAYLQALAEIGVETYDSFLTDGHSEYYGASGHKVVSPAQYEPLTISPTPNREKFLHHLRLHEQGRTTYLEMTRGLAGAGIAKWTFDTHKQTITYVDAAGQPVLTESV